MASPVTGPLVPLVHATGTPMIGMYVGSIIAPSYFVNCQLGIGLSFGVAHLSTCGLAKPPSCIGLVAQSPAARYSGQCVGGGPYWSVSACMMSMTLEWAPSPSVLALRTTFRSAPSWAGKCA